MSDLLEIQNKPIQQIESLFDSLPQDYKIPQIEILDDNYRIPEIAKKAFRAILKYNKNKTIFFNYNGKAVIAIRSGDFIELRLVDINLMKHTIDSLAMWIKCSTRKDGQKRKIIAAPREIAVHMSSDPFSPLPKLRKIVNHPIYTADGRLLYETGFDLLSNIYVLTNPVFEPFEFQDVIEARDYIKNNIFIDFPFRNDSDIAAAFAAIITPFVQELYVGRSAIVVYSGASPGTGKTLLNECCCFPAGGATLRVFSLEDEEFRKAYTSDLMQGAEIISYDNVPELNSAALAMAATSPIWSDRKLGKNEIIKIENNIFITVTGNNISMSTEIARRCCQVRLIAHEDQPWRRTNFKHADLKKYMMENRNKIISAILTLIDNWIQAGKPHFSGKPLASFESWSVIVGGVLENAKIHGFLENMDNLYDQADDEAAPWRELCFKWYQNFSNNTVNVSQLFEIAQAVTDLDLGDGSLKSMKTRFGKMLSKNRDRIFSGFQIVHSGTKQRAALWKLHKVEG